MVQNTTNINGFDFKVAECGDFADLSAGIYLEWLKEKRPFECNSWAV